MMSPLGVRHGAVTYALEMLGAALIHPDVRAVIPLMRGGRARWKIANETCNTLKNQGDNCEHNYGHGKQNLSVVFAMVMMLTFLVDQTQQLSLTAHTPSLRYWSYSCARSHTRRA